MKKIIAIIIVLISGVIGVEAQIDSYASHSPLTPKGGQEATAGGVLPFRGARGV